MGGGMTSSYEPREPLLARRSLFVSALSYRMISGGQVACRHVVRCGSLVVVRHLDAFVVRVSCLR